MNRADINYFFSWLESYYVYSSKNIGIIHLVLVLLFATINLILLIYSLILYKKYGNLYQFLIYNAILILITLNFFIYIKVPYWHQRATHKGDGIKFKDYHLVGYVSGWFPFRKLIKLNSKNQLEIPEIIHIKSIEKGKLYAWRKAIDQKDRTKFPSYENKKEKYKNIKTNFSKKFYFTLEIKTGKIEVFDDSKFKISTKNKLMFDKFE